MLKAIRALLRETDEERRLRDFIEASQALDDMTEDDIARSVTILKGADFRKPEVQRLFTKQDVIDILLTMANKTRENVARAAIVNAIADIAYVNQDIITGSTQLNSVMKLLIEMARNVEDDEVVDGIAKAIINITRQNSDVAAFFIQQGVVDVLIKMTGAKSNIAMTNVMIAIRRIIRGNPATTESFVQQGIADVIIKMIKKADDRLRTEIVMIIGSIVNHPALVEIFVQQDVVDAIIQEARGVKDYIMRANIAMVIGDIVRNNSAATALFIQQGVVDVLIKMAEKANNSADIINIAEAMAAISYNNPTSKTTGIFVREDLAHVLIRMAEDTKNNIAMRNIAMAIANISSGNQAAATLFARLDIVDVLMKMYGQTSAEDTMISIARAVINIAIHTTFNSKVFAQENVANIMILVATRAGNDDVRHAIILAINNITTLAESLPFFATQQMLDALMIMASNATKDSTVEEIMSTLNRLFPENEVAQAHIAEIVQNRSEIKAELAKLDGAIETYKTQSNEPSANEIRRLLERFLTEEQIKRGGAQSLLVCSRPTLEVLCSNPSHIKWANDIAKKYLVACVNQPIAGWFEISALAAIAQAKTMTDKVEAAKIALIFARAISFVALDKEIEARLNVEAVNMLIVAVHDQLLKKGSITKPWLGTPTSVPFIEAIPKDWLAKNVPIFLVQAQEILGNQDLHKTLDEILQGEHGMIWAAITSPHIIAEVDAQFAKDLEELQFVANLLYENHLESFPRSPEELLAGEKFENDAQKSAFIKKYTGKTFLELNEMFKSVEKLSKYSSRAIDEVRRLNHETLQSEADPVVMAAAAAPDTAVAAAAIGVETGKKHIIAEIV